MGVLLLFLKLRLLTFEDITAMVEAPLPDINGDPFLSESVTMEGAASVENIDSFLAVKKLSSSFAEAFVGSLLVLWRRPTLAWAVAMAMVAAAEAAISLLKSPPSGASFGEAFMVEAVG